MPGGGIPQLERTQTRRVKDGAILTTSHLLSPVSTTLDRDLRGKDRQRVIHPRWHSELLPREPTVIQLTENLRAMSQLDYTYSDEDASRLAAIRKILYISLMVTREKAWLVETQIKSKKDLKKQKHYRKTSVHKRRH